MSKPLLLVPVLLAACVDAPALDNSELPATPIGFQQLQLGDAPLVIATGGTQTVSFSDVSTIGWSGTASTGFELVPFADIWPATREQQYRVRAVTADGTGTFAIQTNRGIASGTVTSADVAKLALLPASYQLDGHSPFALDVSRPEVEVALFDASGRRLVDSTLVADATQTAWDTLQIDGSVGTQTIHVTGDSFAAEDLTIALANQVDRVESTTTAGLTCFHAYAGDIEIAKALPLTGTPDPDFANCQR